MSPILYEKVVVLLLHNYCECNHNKCRDDS